MTLLPVGQIPALAFLAVVALGLSSCERGISPEQKAVRAELRQALRERSYEKAASLAQQVVGSAPHENGAWERLVRAQVGMRDLDAATQTLQEWRSIIPTPSWKWDELTGDVAIKKGDPALALDSWTKALVASPANARLLRKLVRLQRAQRHWAEEEALLSRLIDVEETAVHRIQRALCRRRLHRWPEALKDYRRAQQLGSDEPEVRRGAKLLERVSKFLAEIRELDARLAITPMDDQLLADRALLFLRSEDPELALEDSERASQAGGWAMRPRLFRAIALTDLGRAAECAALGIDSSLRLTNLTPEFLETISRLDAEISVERTNPELYVTRAWHLNDIGQPALALEDAESALRFDANSAGAHVESSYALAKLGRAEEAFAKAKRATELDPNFSTGWQYRGELEMSRGDHFAAIDSFSRALAINQTPAALQKREECYIKLGLLAKAEEDHRAREALR
ncbi:MAG: tetratricopeptide repeat protein [Chthoniobacterales bacterium]